MFLTKKALVKIWVMALKYVILGVLCFLMPLVHTALRPYSVEWVVFGIIVLLLALLFYKWGRFSEGKGKLLNKGRKLIFFEMRPAEFIRLYEEARDCPSNVVSEPDFDVLTMLGAAYDALDDEERELEILEQMSRIDFKNKEIRVKILKASVLFDKGRKEEAEEIYVEVLRGKKDAFTTAQLDAVTKCDRALAMGDYAVAEEYCKEQLIRPFPKPTPYEDLIHHFKLAEIYCKTDRCDEAKQHLNYCIENGKELPLVDKARAMLEGI